MREVDVEVLESGEINIWDGYEWIYGVSQELADLVLAGLAAKGSS